MKLLLRTASIAVLAVAAVGCTPPPSAIDPSVDLPTNFTAPKSDATQAAQEWPTPEWWKGFGADELVSLEQTAKASNLDVDTALNRLTIAQASAGTAFAPLLPTVSASASGSRSGSNDGTTTPASNRVSATLSASYQLDFFGQNYNKMRAASEGERSSLYAFGVTSLTVAANVANQYFTVLALRQRIAYAKENIAAAERILKIAEAKVANGVSSNLELSQQQAQVAGQRSNVPQLEEQEREARYQLAILLGRMPENFDIQGQGLDDVVPPAVQPGMPTVLLTRRPDIAVAEANLYQAHANVDAARSAFFPSVSLTASDGSSAGAGLALFSPTTLAWSIGASIAQSIFDSGRLHYASASARANERILINQYRQVVFSALSDVETQLGQVNSTTLTLGFRTEQVRAQTEAERIAELQYREGVSALTDLLNAQTSLFNARDTLVQTKLNRLTATVNLYKALGGGWTMEDANKGEVDAVGWSPL